MEDKYENLKDIETAINTKPIKEIVKHIDFTKCLDKITLESPWTKKNFENNHIIDSELLIADNFQDHFQVVNDIIEKEEDILFYICTWYKEMEDKVRYYSCSGDLIKQRFYDEQVGEVIRKTFTTIYPEGIKKVEVVKLNKIIEKYLGYLPSFCLKPAPWELLPETPQPQPQPQPQPEPQPTKEYPCIYRVHIDNYTLLLQDLKTAKIITEQNNKYKWNFTQKLFTYFCYALRENKWLEVNGQNGIPWTKIASYYGVNNERLSTTLGEIIDKKTKKLKKISSLNSDKNKEVLDKVLEKYLNLGIL